MRSKTIEIFVGLFMLAGLVALVILAFQVSGLTEVGNRNYYLLKANFDNIGDLKVRAPVTIAGVKVGQIQAITLDPRTFKAEVTLQIKNQTKSLPVDTTASILTQGLLGSNYISLTPGFDQTSLKSGGIIATTHSALILENLIGQLLFNLKGDKS
jgi:phospholipid/cholesterol/gamma-HCH transport system substrate-binding protein